MLSDEARIARPSASRNRLSGRAPGLPRRNRTDRSPARRGRRPPCLRRYVRGRNGDPIHVAAAARRASRARSRRHTTAKPRTPARRARIEPVTTASPPSAAVVGHLNRPTDVCERLVAIEAGDQRAFTAAQPTAADHSSRAAACPTGRRALPPLRRAWPGRRPHFLACSGRRTKVRFHFQSCSGRP